MPFLFAGRAVPKGIPDLRYCGFPIRHTHSNLNLAVPAPRLAVGLYGASLSLRYAGFRPFIERKQISFPAYKPLQSLTERHFRTL